MAAGKYRVRMPDGSEQEMTTEQLAMQTGISKKLLSKRLTQYHMRDYARLAMSPEDGRRVAREAFKRGMTGEMMSITAERKAKIAHHRRVMEGNPEVE